MTLSTTSTSVSYNGNGSTTAFSVTFQFYTLYVTETVTATGVVTVKTLGTHYTLTGGNGSTGTLTMLTAPASGVVLTIARATARTQLTDYVENDAFPAATHEKALDRLAMISQELGSEIDAAEADIATLESDLATLDDLAVKAPSGDTAASRTLPTAASRAGKYLAFTDDGSVSAAALSYEDHYNSRTLRSFGAAAGVASDGDAQTNATAWNSAIAWLAESAYRRLVVEPGDWRMRGDLLNDFTADDCEVVFMGGARVSFHVNSLTAGTLFRFNGATRVKVVNPYFTCINTPGVNEFAFDLRSAIEVSITGATLLNVASWVRFGYDGDNLAIRCTFDKARGNINKGVTADATVDLVHCAGTYFDNNIIYGNGAGSSAARNGCLVRVAPPTGCLVDTAYIRWCAMQAFTTSAPSTAPSDCDGRPYGVYVDNSNGPVVNLWVCDNAIDHCTTAGFYFVSNSASHYTRCLYFARNRVAMDAGRAVDFNNASAGVAFGISVENNHLLMTDVECVRLQGDGWRGLTVHNNRFMNSYSSITKSRAALIDCNSVSLIGNIVDTVLAGGTINCTNGIEITNADISGLIVSLNQLHRVSGTPLVEPTYTAASSTRYVGGNTG